MMRLAGVLVIMTASCAGWSKPDYALEASFVAATTADWYQTVGIAGNCDEYNPVIGQCGQRLNPGYYFPIALAVHAVVSAVLPHGWMRATWQIVTTGIEVGQVTFNALGPEQYREHPILAQPPQPR